MLATNPLLCILNLTRRLDFLCSRAAVSSQQLSGLDAWNFHHCSVDTYSDTPASTSTFWSAEKKNLEACPLLSVPISVWVPLETQEQLNMAFVGHLSLSLPSTSVLKDSSLKSHITVWITSAWNMSLWQNGKWTLKLSRWEKGIQDNICFIRLPERSVWL